MQTPSQKREVVKVVYVEKEKYQAKSLKKCFTPTNKTSNIFSGIFVLIILLGIFSGFSFGGLMSGAAFEIKIGWPMAFLILGETDAPLRFVGFIVDLILYLLVAYVLDVLINLAAWRLQESRDKRAGQNKSPAQKSATLKSGNFSNQ